MKNIHVLPTNDYRNAKIFQYDIKNGKFVRWYAAMTEPKNIYITNDEEIKYGDYVYDSITNTVYQLFEKPTKNEFKIILTTDQDLIKDGVQEIPEYFLIHYIVGNNPIEYVEIKEHLESLDTMKINYEIIIPKEEPRTKCYCGHTITCDCGPEQEILLEDIFNDDKKENIKKFIDEIKNPSEPNDKLKQAFEKYSQYLEDFENKDTYEHGFKDGAKCQQERSYSEEEVKDMLFAIIDEGKQEECCITHTRDSTVRKIFEQFKKEII